MKISDERARELRDIYTPTSQEYETSTERDVLALLDDREELLREVSRLKEVGTYYFERQKEA